MGGGRQGGGLLAWGAGLSGGALGVWLSVWRGGVVCYLLGQVESSDAQGPETAEHGEEGQSQVILRDHQGEIGRASCRERVSSPV